MNIYELRIMARFTPNDPRDYLAALDFINLAKEKNFEIELKKYYPKRSSPQNRYLHLILGYFAHCYGCTLSESKEVFFKQYACRDIFLVESFDKNGKRAIYFRSTADLSTVEMSNAISNFRAYASCNGIELPDPNDELAIKYCERQVEKTSIYGT